MIYFTALFLVQVIAVEHRVAITELLHNLLWCMLFSLFSVIKVPLPIWLSGLISDGTTFGRAVVHADRRHALLEGTTKVSIDGSETVPVNATSVMENDTFKTSPFIKRRIDR